MTVSGPDDAQRAALRHSKGSGIRQERAARLQLDSARLSSRNGQIAAVGPKLGPSHPGADVATHVSYSTAGVQRYPRSDARGYAYFNQPADMAA